MAASHPYRLLRSSKARGIIFSWNARRSRTSTGVFSKLQPTASRFMLEAHRSGFASGHHGKRSIRRARNVNQEEYSYVSWRDPPLERMRGSEGEQQQYKGDDCELSQAPAIQVR